MRFSQDTRLLRTLEVLGEWSGKSQTPLFFERPTTPWTSIGQQKLITDKIPGLSGLWDGLRESTRCSRDTYPESYITKYTSVRR